MASRLTPDGASMEYLKRSITEALRKRGDYTPDLDFTIQLCAGSGSTYLKIAHEVQKLKSLTVEVVRTNGSVALEMNPMLQALNVAAETYRRQLSELGLTPKSLGKKHTEKSRDVVGVRLAPGEQDRNTTSDPLAELIEKMNSL